LWRRRTGYYQGRATHWHIRVHPDFEVLPNNTYIGKTLAHTGQLFVQDDINSAVDMMYPYVSYGPGQRNVVEGVRADSSTTTGQQPPPNDARSGPN
jgi:hypothetical protein